jgi:hypothetical protein
MQIDPLEEWRRLTKLYGEMGDIEIRELLRQIGDLTAGAQEVLRTELKKRGIPEHPLPSEQRPPRFTSRNMQETPNDLATFDEDDPHDYTWKTSLCECETTEQVQQLMAALDRAGIDSWVERSLPGYYRILVGADQLERAQEVASQPIPEDIVDEVSERRSTPVESFRTPICPRCGNPDPVLGPVEEPKNGEPALPLSQWVNTWQCDSCGYSWSDPVIPDAAEQGSPSSA